MGLGVSVGRLVGEDGCVSGVGVCCMHDGEEILESCFSWRHVTLLLLDPVSRECKVSWEIRPWYSVLLWQAFPATPSMR